jgi:acetylornithine/succinyldiaminopimelate/putrescine aminotransferase
MNSNLLENVKTTGEYFKQQLLSLKQEVSCIKEVRGKGLMLGIDLDESVSALDAKKELLHKGFVTATAGANVLRFLPPYTIQKRHIDELITALKDVLH